MKWKLDKYDQLRFPIWEKRDLILLSLSWLFFGILLGIGFCIIQHDHYLDARCRMGLMWHDGKQYEVTEVQR
jgi:hypothetical protein